MLFNQTNLTSLGVTCLPQAGCFLSKPDEQTVTIPGMDGQLFAGQTQKAREFPILLKVTGASSSDLIDRLDRVTAWLAAGPARLVFDELPDRFWTARLASALEFEGDGRDFRVTQQITMTADDPHPYAVIDDQATITTTTTIFTRSKGNTGSHPTIRVKAQLTSSQTLTLTLWGQTVTITGPLTSTQVAVLDCQQWLFTIENTSGSVIGNLAPQLSTLDRITCPVGGGPVTWAKTGGTLSSIQIQANSRWL
jgi:predicted phage tail component-like protein